MKIDAFNGLSPMTQDRNSVADAIIQLERAKVALQKELDRRQPGDKFVWGVQTVGGYTNYGEDFGKAVETACREFNDDMAGYRVQRVYL